MTVSISRKILCSIWKNKRALGGIIIFSFVLFGAIFAPLISPHDPCKQNISLRLKPAGWMQDGNRYWLGTDALGRDMASRIIYGSRIALMVSGSALIIGAILGITIGLLSGYFKGILDTVLMRIVDIQLSFPFILLVVAIVAILGPSTVNLILVLGITSWVYYARIVRSEVLSLREREFILAAKALGCGNGKILLLHLLPNVGGSCIVIATLEFARMILAEAALSFLGLGIQPPTPTWGGMLADGRAYLFTAWWLATFPGMALMFTVLGINMLGDWLRDFMR